LPPSGKITFTAPGTYKFICLIHPFMHGTVVVTP
jgi:plastocyanin